MHRQRATALTRQKTFGSSMSTIVDNVAPARRRKPPAYSEIFSAPDQQSIRQDLATFFGPRAEAYLAVYDKLHNATPAERVRLRTWSSPVFFGSFTWFFFRKMYLYGAMLVFTPLLLSYLFGSAGGATSIVFAMFAKRWYVNYGLGRIIKADQLGLVGDERTDYLRRAGGVSWPAGIFAGLIYGFAVALVIVGVMARHKVRHG
jgi:hypothetical protein